MLKLLGLLHNYSGGETYRFLLDGPNHFNAYSANLISWIIEIIKVEKNALREHCCGWPFEYLYWSTKMQEILWGPRSTGIYDPSRSTIMFSACRTQYTELAYAMIVLIHLANCVSKHIREFWHFVCSSLNDNLEPYASDSYEISKNVPTMQDMRVCRVAYLLVF